MIHYLSKEGGNRKNISKKKPTKAAVKLTENSFSKSPVHPHDRCDIKFKTKKALHVLIARMHI